jgi:hypothetical protein
MSNSQCGRCGLQYDPSKLSSVLEHEKKCDRWGKKRKTQYEYRMRIKEVFGVDTQ